MYACTKIKNRRQGAIAAGHLLTACFIILIAQSLQAQSPGDIWDDGSKSRSDSLLLLQLPSSADGQMQNAFARFTTAATAQPLIVSLHTWSGGYDQPDPLAAEAKLRNWNYIHPDFRGPNRRPEAAGSALALADLEDAIRFMLQNRLVDSSQVHIIGVSGGGYMTLMAYMNLSLPIKSFQAWVPIADLNDWYAETLARGLPYAKDLEAIAGDDSASRAGLLENRSPMHQRWRAGMRQGSTLRIFAGVHDGYTGSVPIRHSIVFFNRIAGMLHPEQRNLQVSDSLLICLLAQRGLPSAPAFPKLAGRKIHLHRSAEGIELTLFEGTHEMLPSVALSLTGADSLVSSKPLSIMTIGDSNGAAAEGWPYQLSKLFPFAQIINWSLSGNTVGFDNLGNSGLNAIRHQANLIGRTIDSLEGHPLDAIVILLGTNDAKTIFSEQQDRVAQNFRQLIEITQRSLRSSGSKANILLLAAPPVDSIRADPKKYSGADDRIQRINQQIALLATEAGLPFIDTYEWLRPTRQTNTVDGIHLTGAAQFLIARLLAEQLNKIK